MTHEAAMKSVTDLCPVATYDVNATSAPSRVFRGAAAFIPRHLADGRGARPRSNGSEADFLCVRIVFVVRRLW